jgi:hypothetical protein
MSSRNGDGPDEVPEMPEFEEEVLASVRRDPGERLTLRLSRAQIVRMEAAAGWMDRPSMGGLLKRLLDATSQPRLERLAARRPVFHGREKRETPPALDVDVVMRELRVSRARAQLMLDRGRVEVAGGTVRRAT